MQFKRSGKTFWKMLANKTAEDQIMPRKIFCNISKIQNETSKLADATIIIKVVKKCIKFSDKSINLSKSGKLIQIESFEDKIHFINTKNFISTFKKIAYVLISACCRRIHCIFKKIFMSHEIFCKKRSEQSMVKTIESESFVLTNNSKKVDKNFYLRKFYNKAQIKIQNSRKNMKILIQNQIGIIKSLKNQLRSLIKFDSNRKKYQIRIKKFIDSVLDC